MTHDPAWREELIRLGGSIHQDSEPELSEEEDAAQQAGIRRYHELLDGLTGEEGPAAIEAVLWSLHPIDDYGIYEAAYSALRDFPRAEFGRVAAEVAPAWLARHADVDRLGIALLEVAYDDEAQAAFIEAAAGWDAAQRTAMIPAIESWNREEEGWEPVLAALGRIAPTNDFDPIPEDCRSPGAPPLKPFAAPVRSTTPGRTNATCRPTSTGCWR